MENDSHTITVCTRCIDAPSKTRPGAQLMAALVKVAPATFHIAGADCLAGCGRSTVVGYAAPGKATWVFGNIVTGDLPDLVDFARMYAASDHAWFKGRDCPKKLCDNTLARVPGVM